MPHLFSAQCMLTDSVVTRVLHVIIMKHDPQPACQVKVAQWTPSAHCAYFAHRFFFSCFPFFPPFFLFVTLFCCCSVFSSFPLPPLPPLPFSLIFLVFPFSPPSLLKSTLVVNTDTTVHGVHTNTVAFSPSVLIKCGICSYHH